MLFSALHNPFLYDLYDPSIFIFLHLVRLSRMTQKINTFKRIDILNNALSKNLQ